MRLGRDEITRPQCVGCYLQFARGVVDQPLDHIGGFRPARAAIGIDGRGILTSDGIEDVNSALRRVERFWSDQIRYIY